MSDDELQHKIEQGLYGKGADERAYRAVFDAAKKSPKYRLPSDFADRVLIRMEAEAGRSTSREIVWFYVGLISFVIAAGIAVALTGFKINFGALKFISGYSSLLIFGAAFILVLQWVDKTLIKKASV